MYKYIYILFYLMFIWSFSEAKQIITNLEKSLIEKPWTCYTEYIQSILCNSVTLSILYMYTHSPLQKVIHLIIYWISWRISYHNNLYHSSAQINALYSSKFSFSIFFITLNCFRTSALMNQQTAYFIYSDYIKISLKRWILQTINRLTWLYFKQ